MIDTVTRYHHTLAVLPEIRSPSTLGPGGALPYLVLYRAVLICNKGLSLFRLDLEEHGMLRNRRSICRPLVLKPEIENLLTGETWFGDEIN